jgi:hypothetical protein
MRAPGTSARGLAQRKSPTVADEEKPDEPAKPDAAPADKPA